MVTLNNKERIDLFEDQVMINKKNTNIYIYIYIHINNDNHNINDAWTLCNGRKMKDI